MTNKKEKQQAYKNYTYDFSYTIKINDNIVLTREFNVRNYNDDFRESLEAKELMVELMGDGTIGLSGKELGIIPRHLIRKSVSDMWHKYDRNYIDDLKEPKEKEDILVLEINYGHRGINRETILSSAYNMEHLQNSVSTQIDIKPILKEIMGIIKDYMSLGTYTKEWKGVQLKRLNKLNHKQLLNAHK